MSSPCPGNTSARIALLDGRHAARFGVRVVMVKRLPQYGGATVGAMVRDPAAGGISTTTSIPNTTSGALLAGGAIATYFFGYMWVAAGLMAGSLYLLVFRKSPTIEI